MFEGPIEAEAGGIPAPLACTETCRVRIDLVRLRDSRGNHSFDTYVDDRLVATGRNFDDAMAGAVIGSASAMLELPGKTTGEDYAARFDKIALAIYNNCDTVRGGMTYDTMKALEGLPGYDERRFKLLALWGCT